MVQRINIHFCVQLGWSQSHTITVIQAIFGEESLCRTSIRKWYNQFKNGRTQLVDLARAPRRKSGRSQGNIDRIQRLVQVDRRVTVGSLQAQTGLPQGTIHSILWKDLKLKKKCVHFVPHLLTPRHLRLRFDISTMMLWIIWERPGILKRIITVDETWIYMYDPQSRAQSSQWLGSDDSRPEIARRSRTSGKVLLISFFDWRGMVHHEYLRNRTVNTTRFLGILSRLQTSLNIRRPRRRNQLHMDNATPHNAHEPK